MIKRALLALTLGLMLSSCAPAREVSAPAAAMAPAAPAAPAATAATAALSPPPTPGLTPEPTPAIRRASLGFVGDVMLMTSQISYGRQEGGGYDFSRSFEAMEPLFNSVDIMCANYEGTFAGEEAGYTQPRPPAPEPTADNPNPSRPYQTFNSPDELAGNMRDAGIDLVSTANNHCLDRGIDGLFRTVEVIRGEGLLQVGTFTSEEQRFTPCIAEVDGIKIGFVAACSNVNRRDGLLDEHPWAASRFRYHPELLEREIRTIREAGAEFIVAIAHWGEEYNAEIVSRQKEIVDWLLNDWKVDAIVGSHPHVVQPMEWAEAEDGRKVFVAYSLGNFISNMSGKNSEYGAFLRLDLTKDADGKITCEPSYIPLLCLRNSGEDGGLHQTIPCWQDADRRSAVGGGGLGEAEDAFEHVTEICGLDTAALIGWSEEYDKQA